MATSPAKNHKEENVPLSGSLGVVLSCRDAEVLRWVVSFFIAVVKPSDCSFVGAGKKAFRYWPSSTVCVHAFVSPSE